MLELVVVPAMGGFRVEPSEGDGGQDGHKSRMALRRKRERERSPPQQSKKERMKDGRLKKAQAQSIQTDITLQALKPGLKLVGHQKKVYTLEELQGSGFRVLVQLGMCVFHLLTFELLSHAYPKGTMSPFSARMERYLLSWQEGQKIHLM